MEARGSSRSDDYLPVMFVGRLDVIASSQSMSVIVSGVPSCNASDFVLWCKYDAAKYTAFITWVKGG